MTSDNEVYGLDRQAVVTQNPHCIITKDHASTKIN